MEDRSEEATKRGVGKEWAKCWKTASNEGGDDLDQGPGHDLGVLASNIPVTQRGTIRVDKQNVCSHCTRSGRTIVVSDVKRENDIRDLQKTKCKYTSHLQFLRESHLKAPNDRHWGRDDHQIHDQVREG
jgi:hypothetical protein